MTEPKTMRASGTPEPGEWVIVEEGVMCDAFGDRDEAVAWRDDNFPRSEVRQVLDKKAPECVLFEFAPGVIPTTVASR